MADLDDLFVKNAPKNTGKKFVIKHRPRKKLRTWMMYALFNNSYLAAISYKRKDAEKEGINLYSAGHFNEGMKSGWFSVRKVIITDWGYGQKFRGKP